MSTEEIRIKAQAFLDKMKEIYSEIKSEIEDSKNYSTIKLFDTDYIIAKANADYLKRTMVKALDGSLLTDIMDAATTTS